MNGKDMSNREKSKRVSVRAAFFGVCSALALALSFVESLMPPLGIMPLGAKLGLANVETMASAVTLGAPYALAISVMKGLFAFVTRGFTAMLMSLFGSLASCAVVCILLRIRKLSGRFLIISVIGAITHNLTQLLVCVILMTDIRLFLYAPALVLFAVIAGIITGSILKLISYKFGIINTWSSAKRAGRNKNGDFS